MFHWSRDAIYQQLTAWTFSVCSRIYWNKRNYSKHPIKIHWLLALRYDVMCLIILQAGERVLRYLCVTKTSCRQASNPVVSSETLVRLLVTYIIDIGLIPNPTPPKASFCHFLGEGGCGHYISSLSVHTWQMWITGLANKKKPVITSIYIPNVYILNMHHLHYSMCHIICL